jgi:ornithine cyclodeaminase
MPCFTESSFGTKLVSLFPENLTKNLPILYGTMLLNDGKTGKPIAVLDGSTLTAFRTGAVGGVGIRYTTPEDVTGLGVVGAGVQGFHQILFACAVRDFKKVVVYDRFPEKSEIIVKQLMNIIPKVDIRTVSSSDELLRKSQVIITATNSLKPVLPDQTKVLQGKHFIGIGSYKPNMREFPESLFKLIQNCFIDTEHALEESGDVIDPIKRGWLKEERIRTLGNLIMNPDDYPKIQKQTTLFKSVGMALFDVVISELIYNQARDKGLGTKVKM